MYPILGRYGPFFLYSYTVAIALGLLAAIGQSAWQARRTAVSGWFNGLLLSVFAGLIGGRLGFVLFRWDYFQHHLSEIGQVWLGGLGFHGALLAGLLAFWGWSAWQKQPWRPSIGLLAPGLAMAATFGWLACWLEGCAYGRPALLGLLAADLPDELGVFGLRYRTQQLGMMLALLTWLAAMRAQRHGSSAAWFWLVLFGVSLSRFLTSLLRGDPMPELWQIRIDTLADALLMLLSLILLQYERLRVKEAG